MNFRSVPPAAMIATSSFKPALQPRKNNASTGSTTSSRARSGLSTRFKEDHPYYKLARAVGAELAKAGYATLTGGGPGIMEAANRGAQEAGGAS